MKNTLRVAEGDGIAMDGGVSGVDDGLAVPAGMSRPDSVQATQAKRRATAAMRLGSMVRNVSRNEPSSLHAGSRLLL